MIHWQPGVTIEEVEEQVIKKALGFFRTKHLAAEALGISVRTIDNKLAKYAEREKPKNENTRTEASQGQPQGV